MDVQVNDFFKEMFGRAFLFGASLCRVSKESIANTF